MKIALIHGANFRYLHKREATLYGAVSLLDIEKYLQTVAKHFHNPLECIALQSNIEGELINYLEYAFEYACDGVIINAGAYTHTSIAIADCLEWLPIPCVEVHISQIFAREEFRTRSIISSKCIASISGCGIMGYGFALELLAKRCGNAYEG